MELQQWMIDYVESQSKWDEDIKQDIYVKIMELDATKEINKSYIASMYHSILWNEFSIERRRRDILATNVDAVRKALGMDGEADDPLETISTLSEIQERLKEMSPLLRGTLQRVVLGGETPEELAEEEGTTPNVIYQRVWQIKQQLKGKE